MSDSEKETKQKIRRMELAFDEASQQRIVELRKKAQSVHKCDTDLHLMRNALMVYEWFLDRIEEGSHLGYVKQGKFYKVEFEGLS